MNDLVPLSSSQEVLMYSYVRTPWEKRMEHEGLIMNLYFLVKKDFNEQALQNAFNNVTLHNDAMRLFFVMKNGKLWQKVQEWTYQRIEKVVLKQSEQLSDFMKKPRKYPVVVELRRGLP